MKLNKSLTINNPSNGSLYKANAIFQMMNWKLKLMKPWKTRFPDILAGNATGSILDRKIEFQKNQVISTFKTLRAGFG